MRSLPLPVTLTARLLPVAVLACVGWAWSTGPMSDSADKENKKEAAPQSSASHEASESVAAKTYAKPPAPCGTVTARTVSSLVPGAKTAGKELAATDESVRRGCSWSALKEYDYRWLDVSFEVKNSDTLAEQAYKSGSGSDGTAQSIGDEARLATNVVTKDKQQTREAVVTVRVANTLVTVTYNGSDFESKGAPSADTVNKGALQAARDAVAALQASGKDA
ncbi:hypothetical protein OKJ48_28730 [Streptomyces kunmingensis]|uniref:DUF3558 domain-containing protein n=1 Tax=Streptomyces kunmingensis TaxID=68225 RepID=A0ABU6CHT8_9ACTN|nr:hypothetical protein [Streptomyces kunmingensis]MEB3964197.1 hypothetical protein [Streptomyces kunmingensis]